MKFLHTSDWHLGRRLLSVDMHDYHAQFLDWLITTAVEEKVDIIVVAGDVFDRALPATDAVTLLDDTIARCVEANIPMLMIAGNHDSPIRLHYGSRLFTRANIHVRASVTDIDKPVIMTDVDGDVGFYGIPFLLPDAVMEELGAERSHASVLGKAMDRINTDAQQRGLARTVVAAHAFIGGSSGDVEESDSERDISVGGVHHAPAEIFSSASYVALGHLHGRQAVTCADTTIHYSGSPLAFSFSEKHHTKSVTIVDLDGAGEVSLTHVPVPQPRALREVRGTLEELVDLAVSDDTGIADAWVKAILTDVMRPASPMETLQRHWPHTIALDFQPEHREILADAGTKVDARTDPVMIIEQFVREQTNQDVDEATLAIIREVVESTRPEAHERPVHATGMEEHT